MGVLPLQFLEGENARSLGLTGREMFAIGGLSEELTPQQRIHVRAESDEGAVTEFEVLSRIDSRIEIEYFKHGGILDYVLREYMKD
jgi:aconitate hydratase